MRRLATVVSFAALCAAAAPLRASCTLPPEVRVQLDLMGLDGRGHYNHGSMLYDFSCFDEAVAELKLAVEMLGASDASNSPSESALLALARDALTLAKAQQLVRGGDRKEAIPQMMQIARGVDSLVKLRALVAVVPLLDAASPYWPVVERELEVLAGNGYWQAEKVIAQRRTARGDAAAAAAHLEQRLAEAETVHDAFAYSVLLADVWRAGGRTVEAWLLIRRIERDAGTDLLDAELRVELIRVASSVASVRAAAGDAAAARAKATYDAALREVTGR